MALNMYIITFKGGFNQGASQTVQRYVKQLGGYVLMVTPNGPIVAMDDGHAPAVGRHPMVAFVGGITFNPKGVAAKELQSIFVENLRKQRPQSEAREPEDS
jgi:hypothetical protein